MTITWGNMPPALDLDSLRPAYDAALARRHLAEDASRGADDTGDMAEYDRAEALFRKADDEAERLADKIDDLDAAMNMVADAKPIFAHKPPAVQGAALAELTAIWLAGHVVPGDPEATDNMQQDILNTYCQYVLRLVAETGEQRRAHWQGVL